jgi:hypothetical protein
MNDRDAKGNAALLEAAGYQLHAVFNLWKNSVLDRAIDGDIAETLGDEQIRDWIATGNAQRPTP